MSPVTAIIFIFASSGILLLCLPPAEERLYKAVASFMGLFVSAAGFIFIVGYLHGAPLLYGRNIIPLAFPTAAAFAFLGLGIILASGSSVPVVRIFIGSSMRSRLTRAFLPVAVAFVLISDLIDTIAEYLAINTALTLSFTAVTSAIVVGLVIAKIAKSIGMDLDQSNRERDEKVIALGKSEEEAKSLAQENELIAEIGRVIGSTLDIEEVYNHFAEKVRGAIPFDSIVINTVNRDNNTRSIRYVNGEFYSGNHLGAVFPIAGTRTEQIVRTKSSILINLNPPTTFYDD